MKKFKDLMEEVMNEGQADYPADDMTMKEVKIACYAAQQILDMMENGAMVQRWQISAIVKAAEELTSVYTSMSADEDEYYDDEDDYDDEEEDMYVGYEYPSMYGEETKLDEVEGSAKRNRELHATGRITKDEYDRRMGYGKYKTKGSAGVGPLGKTLYKNLVTSAIKKEGVELEEGYNDPIHREYISKVVHEYFPKGSEKHDKIVDHLHKAKNFGTKTSDSLESHAGISTGAAMRVTKAVADELKTNFGTQSKPQTQAQRIGAYLKQKHIGPIKR